MSAIRAQRAGCRADRCRARISQPAEAGVRHPGERLRRISGHPTRIALKSAFNPDAELAAEYHEGIC